VESGTPATPEPAICRGLGAPYGTFRTVVGEKPTLTWREKLGPDWLDEHPPEQWLPYAVITFFLINLLGMILELGHVHRLGLWWMVLLAAVLLLAYLGFIVQRVRSIKRTSDGSDQGY